MITGSISLRFEYESTRLSRYGDITQNVYYAPEELQKAYDAWADHPYGREQQWNAYCDLRDQVPRGTNARIQKKREEAHLHRIH